MRRLLALALFFSVPAAACAHRYASLPVLAVPAQVQRQDVIPSLAPSAMAVPIAIPLAELTQLMRERMVIPDMPDWKQVTESDHSPELSIRYAAELLAPRIASEGQTLRITLPVAYHGSFKARVKTPFGWMWLTKGTNWGDAERRGLIEVEVASQLDISSAWQLTSSTSLVDVRLTPPPISKLCTSGAFKLCVPADMVTERVHRELDARVREKVASGLAEVDAQIAQRVNLPELSRMVWERLQQARAGLSSGETLALAPEQMALSYPVVQGDVLQAELRVWGKASTAAPASGAALPPPSGNTWSGNDVELHVPVSLPTLSAAFTRALANAPALRSGDKVTRLELLGSSAAHPGDWLLAATLSVEERSFIVYAQGVLTPTAAGQALIDVRLLPESQQLLSAANVNGAELIAQLQVGADLSALLDERLNAARTLLAQAVAPWPANALEGARAYVHGGYAAGAAGVLLVVKAR